MSPGMRESSGASRAPAAGDHVVFDLGGVLVDWNPRHLYCRHLGADPETVDAFLATVCGPEWHAALDLGASFEGHVVELARRFPMHAQWIRRYDALWEQMFAGEFRRSLAVLESLAARGCQLHALSNYPGEKLAFLYRTFPFMRRFQTVVISGLLGVAKPDPRVFAYTRRVIGEGPSWFIDDRPENVAAAREAGFYAVHYAALEPRHDLGRLLGLAS